MALSALTLDDQGATLGAWTALIRRARLGATRKAAALIVASYADHKGESVYCGVARLAVDLELSYAQARRYLKWMRDVGLIQLVRKGNARRGRSDEYRLIFGPDLIEHLDLPTPSDYDALVAKVADANRSGQRARRQPVENPAQSALILVSADNSDQRSFLVSADSPISAHP